MPYSWHAKLDPKSTRRCELKPAKHEQPISQDDTSMTQQSLRLEAPSVSIGERELVMSALHGLPNHCAVDVDDLARRVGIDKLELIRWFRADLHVARLATSKVSKGAN